MKKIPNQVHVCVVIVKSVCCSCVCPKCYVSIILW